MLYGRDAELAAITALLDGARRGTSGALVVRGEAGIGKSALLDHAATTATGLRVIRGAGVESEAELPFAALQLLLRPALDRLGALPGVQADALRAALGLAAGDGYDRFLVGLAVLSLLSELAEDGPVLCLVDDAHLVDRASADALVFAARRLGAEGVVLLMAARDGEPSFAAHGLPELRLRGLDAGPAEALLGRSAERLGPVLRRRVLAEAAGNPLALDELPKALAARTPDAAATGTPPGGAAPRHASGVLTAPPEGALPLTDRLREVFQGRLARLPEATRTLLLVAALEEGGDLDVVLRAGERLGAGAGDLAPAEDAGLVRVVDRTAVFRHSLLRAAVREGAPVGARVAAHDALAAALGHPADADRRAWHLAAAATGPDERVAAELERTAVRARERSGYAAAAAAHERAAALSPDAGPQGRRLALAAEAAAEAGDLDRSAGLAERASRHPAEPAAAARLTELRAAASFWRGANRTAFRLLSAGADLVTGDPRLATSLLIEAGYVGWYTGERELAEAVDRLAAVPLPADDPLAPARRLLLLVTSPVTGRDTIAPGGPSGPAEPAGPGGSDPRPPGARSADPELYVAEARAAAGDPAGRILVAGLALVLGQDATAAEITAELAAETRERGRIGWLPQVLFYLASAQAFSGRYADARATIAEALGVARDTGQRMWEARLAEPRAILAAVAGDEALCRRLTDTALTEAATGDPSWEVPWAYSTLGLLDLGAGRADSALSRLETLARGRERFHIPAIRSTPDLVEAAVRTGRPDIAAGALARYEDWARHARRPWIDAVLERCRALVAPGERAEEHYTTALRRHATCFRPFDEARTALLYGEWLRRARRKAEAGARLRVALEAFERLGAAPWADRARTELGATGTSAAHGTAPEALAGLTPQELQIVRLAARGLSNRDIAAGLFISPRTVGYHLYKAYPKLGVTSRAELPPLLTTLA